MSCKCIRNLSCTHQTAFSSFVPAGRPNSPSGQSLCSEPPQQSGGGGGGGGGSGALSVPHHRGHRGPFPRGDFRFPKNDILPTKKCLKSSGRRGLAERSSLIRHPSSRQNREDLLHRIQQQQMVELTRNPSVSKDDHVFIKDVSFPEYLLLNKNFF